MRDEVDLKASLAQLETALESTVDGIIIISRQGKIVSYNQKFRKMWHIPTRILKTGNNDGVVQCILKQLKDPDGFLSKLTTWRADPGAYCFDEIELKDGRIFERYSIPQNSGSTLIGRVLSFRDITKRKETEHYLIYQAAHDALTSLPNRVLLADRITQDIKYAKRFNLKVGVLFFDLDKFKSINDSLGHDIGDALLQVVAERLRKCIRDCDTLARWGGDEFVMVIPNLKQEEDIIPVIEACLATLEEIFSIDSHSISITSSVGASFFPRDGEDPVVLLKNADTAMYIAKNEGCNNFRFYVSKMNDHANKQLELENDLQQALKKKQLFLQYQPRIDLKTGDIVAVEALLRWQHPTRGLIVPLDFIQLLEDTGLIHPVGEWVLREVCTQNKTWQNLNLQPIKVSVNMSGTQFKQKNITTIIQNVLTDTGLASCYLEIELTENNIMQNTDTFLHQMKVLEEIGVRLIIDDFGTGYSSLGYLKRLPVGKIKIDKSFIHNLMVDEDDRTIVQATIAMAQKLKLRVVAEGVETAEQYAFLQANNCDEMQGYYFSQPLDAAACEKMLRHQQEQVELPTPLEQCHTLIKRRRDYS